MKRDNLLHPGKSYYLNKRYRPFTKEDLVLLRELSKSLCFQEVSKIMNFSLATIYKYATHFNITLSGSLTPNALGTYEYCSLIQQINYTIPNDYYLLDSANLKVGLNCIKNLRNECSMQELFSL